MDEIKKQWWRGLEIQHGAHLLVGSRTHLLLVHVDQGRDHFAAARPMSPVAAVRYATLRRQSHRQVVAWPSL